MVIFSGLEMGLASIFLWSAFNFWHALRCRDIISDCMRSGVPKLPKMGIWDLNMCFAKNPNVQQIWSAEKSFENFSYRMHANFRCTFQLIICSFECLQSTEGKNKKLSLCETKLFLLNKLNEQKHIKFDLRKKVSQIFLTASVQTFAALSVR